MENEGIMALPQGASMPDEQAQEPQTVTSAQSYDAAQTALGMASPDDLGMLKESLRQNMADLALTPSQLTTLIEIFEYMSQRPAEYKTIRQDLINNDFVDQEDLPEEYDPEFIGALLSVLNELQMTQAQGAQAPMTDMPPVEGADAMQGMQPMAMAEGGLADVASFLAAQGRNGDKMLAHITPEEAQLLKDRGGSGTINPTTGLPEFFLKKIFKAIKSVVKSVVNVTKKILKSPIGRILGTIALATVLGPAGVGLSLGSTAATSAAINMGLASAGTTLLGGGSVKEALISGAMGYIGGGGTVMGANPVSAVGGYLPGAAGSALNTGLATGIIGAGVGKLGGMSTQDALRMGLTSGASAAAMTGLNSMQQQQAGQDAQFRADYAKAGGEGGAPQPGGVGQVGPTGTAQDLLASQSAPGGSMPADYQAQFYKDIGIDPRTMSPTSVGPSPTNIQIERGSLGMTGIADTARQAMSEPLNVAKDIYNTNLSPSRPGLPADAGIIQKYGPMALAGTAVMGATGGFEGKPGDPNPLFERSYTGMDYMRDNPNMFRGGLDTSYTRPTTPRSPIVETNFAAQGPSAPPGQVVPMGASMSPAGVAQPYNVAGLYGVPLIYGQGAQPQRLAKGGSPVPTEFPRKNGPINGPGTGTSDDIPAMLSDGEFVFTAKAVRNAGNGSRRKGAARMYKLMKMLEGGPVKGK
jgi:hypothetical protein